MAEHLTLTEARNYPLSTGATADLIALIGTGTTDWMTSVSDPAELAVGDVAYVHAMGDLRRGVVTKLTKTKIRVTFTTQSAATSSEFGDIRVQTSASNVVWIKKAPAAPAPVEVEEAPETDLVPLAVDADLALPAWPSVAGVETPAEPVGADNDAHLPVAGVDGTSLGEMRQAFRDEDETEAPAVREATGSSVVKLLERVHQRIRQNHPEVPEVVIVTGAGIGMGGSNKWGHFRPRGWTALGEFVPEANEHSRINLHEMFMAGETLAKGSHQVLQTMLHESAHALAEHRGEKDTSRQGRWHNAVFRKTAEELGLEYKGGKADKTLGFSAVTLTAETIKEYADLLDELDAEIHLMVRLPGWLGGSDDDQDDNGGENMGKAPKGTETKSTSNVKLTCLCEEPNIIRASKKVADKTIVRCDDCHALFMER